MSVGKEVCAKGCSRDLVLGRMVERVREKWLIVFGRGVIALGLESSYKKDTLPRKRGVRVRSMGSGGLVNLLC